MGVNEGGGYWPMRRTIDACAESDDFGPPHDGHCESEFVIEAGAWSPCQCGVRWERITSITQENP